jgi:hypothetical protein
MFADTEQRTRPASSRSMRLWSKGVGVNRVECPGVGRLEVGAAGIAEPHPASLRGGNAA